MENNSPKQTGQIAGAIVLAGLLIAGAIILKGNSAGTLSTGDAIAPTVQLAPISAEDRMLGNTGAKVAVIEYADFQCPFCEKFFTDTEQVIRDDYVKSGKVKFIYRDYAFLGEESKRAAEAARCANDQGKFWEYHDYLFNHQSGENKGAFSDTNLKSFAKTIGLDTASFNQCFDSEKYAKAVADSALVGNKAGVRGTPKGFILKNGKIVDTIDGAEDSATVTAKIDSALK